MQKIKYAILILGIIVFFTIWLSAPLPGLSRPAQTSIAIFVLCVVLWVTNFLPMSITGLIAIVAIPLLQVADSKATFALFGSSAIFFILGAFILSTSLMKSGLSKRLAVFFLKNFDRNPAMLVLGVLVTTFFLAFWMPAHAVTAMMFPIVLEIVESLRLKPKESKYAMMLFFGLAWGAIIGGIATFLGGARAPLALELLRDNREKLDLLVENLLEYETLDQEQVAALIETGELPVEDAPAPEEQTDDGDSAPEVEEAERIPPGLPSPDPQTP